MVKFVCGKCNYRFEADKPRKCPYCGEGKVEYDKSAEELLNDVKIE